MSLYFSITSDPVLILESVLVYLDYLLKEKFPEKQQFFEQSNKNNGPKTTP
jgi:hypothetical protein